jgi:putative phosphoribosyl transferase
MPRFEDRRHAGRQLAKQLMHYCAQKPVVLALPRGGVPVAYEVAKALRAPLDIVLVRKICAPERPELAIGALVDGAMPQLVLAEGAAEQYDPDYIAVQRLRQMEEIERRRQLYRGDSEALDVRQRLAILVDDGIATGATIRAALQGLANLRPAHLILAVPVAAPAAMQQLTGMVDEVYCLEQPEEFSAVSVHYEEFGQTSDEEVIDLLAAARYGI